MSRTCRNPIKREDPFVVLDRVEVFAKEALGRGEKNACYAMPLEWILQIANIVRELQEKKG